MHAVVRVEGGVATIGITDYAQDMLGDIVFIKLAEVGTRVMRDQAFGKLESMKAVSGLLSPISGSDLLSPISGIVMDTNDELDDEPSKVNDNPYGEGWMIRMVVEDTGELADLMTATEYSTFLEKEKNEG